MAHAGVAMSKRLASKRCATEVVEPLKGDSMFLTVAIILAVVWALGWFAFHAAGGLIHLLLIVALISVVVHFVRGRGARA
jgi:Family of unknown function (DUF5670)